MTIVDVDHSHQDRATQLHRMIMMTVPIVATGMNGIPTALTVINDQSRSLLPYIPQTKALMLSGQDTQLKLFVKNASVNLEHTLQTPTQLLTQEQHTAKSDLITSIKTLFGTQTDIDFSKPVDKTALVTLVNAVINLAFGQAYMLLSNAKQISEFLGLLEQFQPQTKTQVSAETKPLMLNRRQFLFSILLGTAVVITGCGTPEPTLTPKEQTNLNFALGIQKMLGIYRDTNRVSILAKGIINTIQDKQWLTETNLGSIINEEGATLPIVIKSNGETKVGEKVEDQIAFPPLDITPHHVMTFKATPENKAARSIVIYGNHEAKSGFVTKEIFDLFDKTTQELFNNPDVPLDARLHIIASPSSMFDQLPSGMAHSNVQQGKIDGKLVGIKVNIVLKLDELFRMSKELHIPLLDIIRHAIINEITDYEVKKSLGSHSLYREAFGTAIAWSGTYDSSLGKKIIGDTAWNKLCPALVKEIERISKIPIK